MSGRMSQAHTEVLSVIPLRTLIVLGVAWTLVIAGIIYLAATAEGSESHVCYDNGTEGVITADGSCLTPREYAVLFATASAEPNPLLQTTVRDVTVGEKLFGLTHDHPLMEQPYEVFPAGTYGAERWRPLVAFFFAKAGIPERTDQAMRVLNCESQGRPDAVNRQGSSATGLFQHLTAFMRNNAWRIGLDYYDRKDPVLNVQVTALVVANDGGWRQWACRP